MASIYGHGNQRIISRSNSDSPRGHISPPHEASTLLSPVQLHRDSPVQDRNTPANVEHVEDETERQPSLSPFLAPSNPSSTQEEKDARPTSFRRATHWKTVGTIIGFLFAALLSALGHYLLVRNLNGTLTDTAYLTQSQVSAVSILLTTIFKAALTASTGTCFAQHLWFILRGNAMPLSAIEKLFVFRTNILVLGDLRSIWRAPLLFLMALLVWCLGLATIYPPGSLVVTFEAYTSTENYNVPVMNPPVPQGLDISVGAMDLNEIFPTLIEGGVSFISVPDNDKDRWQTLTFGYGGPTASLNTIAQSIIVNNQVFNLPVHPGENSTYGFQFRGPQFCCAISRYHSSIPLLFSPNNPDHPDYPDLLEGLVFDSKWDLMSLLYSVIQHRIGNYTIQRGSQNITTYTAFVETIEQSCRADSVLYDVNVTFPRGVQKFEHSLSDARPLLTPMNIGKDYGLLWFKLPPEPQDQNHGIAALLPIFNEWALLDALGHQLTGDFYETALLPDVAEKLGYGSVRKPHKDDYCQESNDLNNATRTLDCRGWHGQPINLTGTLKGTVFHTARFDRTFGTSSPYDPRAELDLSEGILNDILTNLTLSAISLGTWWDMVPVTTTRYRSTYTLSNPLNLIIPYSICLAAATLFAAIAIWSLWQNSVPAADGGFLQIMMATRGNTEMERLILKERLAAIDNMSNELKSVKIRYGELVGENVLGVEGRRMGFGTVQETVSLRKRRSRGDFRQRRGETDGKRVAMSRREEVDGGLRTDAHKQTPQQSSQDNLRPIS